MLEKFKSLTLKQKITYPIYALASIIIGIGCVLFFFGAFDLDMLILISGISMIVICIASMINVSYKEDKKTFIINILYIVILLAIVLVTQLF
jgi:uncharacterized membrane protein HdeD (DUF308 family)